MAQIPFAAVLSASRMLRQQPRIPYRPCSRRSSSTYRLKKAAPQVSLPPPTILFQNNHLLAINKPPGWQSIPNNHNSSSKKSGADVRLSQSHSQQVDVVQTQQQPQAQQTHKCLLTYLQQLGMGGGSDQSFLLPLHRLDQPCSGVLLFGKTSKAASRIQSNWKSIEKSYLVLVPTESWYRLDRKASLIDTKSIDENYGDHSERWAWAELRGLMQRNRYQNQNTTFHDRGDWEQKDPRGWSVKMVPWSDKHHSEKEGDCRQLYWRRIDIGRKSDALPYGAEHTLLQIRTSQGSRHMIRALLACHGSPLCGDVRYGAAKPLPDRSVALHARSLVLPAHIQLNVSQIMFVAPIPALWKGYFGWDENMVLKWEKEVTSLTTDTIR